MNRDQRREKKRTARKEDARRGDAARRQTMTRPLSEGAEASNHDPDWDEGGES